MQYINRMTGEIIDISPYRLHLLREAVRAYPRPEQPEYLAPARTYHVRRRNRTSWGYWLGQFVSHFGPLLITMYVLWVLINGRIEL